MNNALSSPLQRVLPTSIPPKLMQLEIKNQIVDDSDFKPAHFDHQFWSDSKSNNESELMIAILI